jgi:hypothetical protein
MMRRIWQHLQRLLRTIACGDHRGHRMKLFKCQSRGQLLYFENRTCQNCSHKLGYLLKENFLSALEQSGTDWRALAAPETLYRFCGNSAFDVCNWLVSSESSEKYCTACRHNRMVPDHRQPGNLAAWYKLEVAKHRLIYTLMRLKLPLENRNDIGDQGLAFDFLADAKDTPTSKVMTGHDDGLITIALAEADDVERERRRNAMREPYRTLLGHFRHEVGHYYWDRLVRNGGKLDAFRKVFGDDREDYDEALQKHYTNGAPSNWQERFVSSYATTHPWEDFAETWAHYLHIVDTLEMAEAFNLRASPQLNTDIAANVDFTPYAAADVRQLTNTWIPLTFALNSLNRTMGREDLYPFIISPPVIEKLRFIHDLVHQAEQGQRL